MTRNTCRSGFDTSYTRDWIDCPYLISLRENYERVAVHWGGRRCRDDSLCVDNRANFHLQILPRHFRYIMPCTSNLMDHHAYDEQRYRRGALVSYSDQLAELLLYWKSMTRCIGIPSMVPRTVVRKSSVHPSC